jgi:hypothetical protein
LLIVLISPEIELGLMYHFLHKLSSTAKQEVAVMVECLHQFTLMLKLMVSQKNLAKTMKPKILLSLPAQISKNVKIVLLQKVINQEIPEIAGQHPIIQFGKLNNMV